MQEILKKLSKYLPRFYTNLVLEELGLEKTPSNIRKIQNTKAGRTNHKEVQKALIKIAFRFKKAEEDLKKELEEMEVQNGS